MAPPSMEAGGDAPLDAERRAVAAMKKVALMVLGTAMQTYGAKLPTSRKSCSRPRTSSSTSTDPRARCCAPSQAGGPLCIEAAARVYINDAAGRVEASAKTALAAMADGDTLRTLLAALRRLLKVTPINTVVAAPSAGGCHGRATDVSVLSRDGRRLTARSSRTITKVTKSVRDPKILRGLRDLRGLREPLAVGPSQARHVSGDVSTGRSAASGGSSSRAPIPSSASE